MPRLDAGMQSGRIIEWLKKEGDIVDKDEPIVVVEGEKTTFEVSAPGKGVVLRLLFAQDADVQVGQPMALVGDPSEPLPPDISMQEEPETRVQHDAELSPRVERVRETPASPVARRLAREAGIDLSQIKGTGPGGRIIREDVLSAMHETKEGLQQVHAPLQVRSIAIAETLRLSGKRKTIAERLSYASHTTVPVTITMDVSMDQIAKSRENLRSKTEDDVSITAYVVKAAAKALEDNSLINSSLEGDEIRLYRDINVAVAIHTPEGLVAPVIPQTNDKSVLEVSRQIRSLTERALQNTLTVSDVTGGTFTVTNLGGYGVELFAPVINPPQCAILGFGRTSDRAVVIEKDVRVSSVTTLSLVFDHRIVDGVPAAQFLQKVKEFLEDPSKLE